MSKHYPHHVVVPWYDEKQLGQWLDAWGINPYPPWLHLIQDETRAGSGATKNRGIFDAIAAGAEIVVVLDDDCYPSDVNHIPSLEGFVELHVEALQPQPVALFEIVTEPPSRGTPFKNHYVKMPVAASMGFWEGVGDYDGLRQLVYDGADMTFATGALHGRYFPLSGMNLAFRVDWMPWCSFVDVPRFDDIWMGWMWQRNAYDHGYCFNFNGPRVRHARQSNVWNNLQVEAVHLERNETLWSDIATHPDPTYDKLCALLPASAGGSDR